MTIDEYNYFIQQLNEQNTKKLDLSKYKSIGDDVNDYKKKM